MRYKGCGKRIGAYFTLNSAVPKVSPVFVSANLGMTTISPAFATSTGTCCLPIKVTILPHFSSTSRVTL